MKGTAFFFGNPRISSDLFSLRQLWQFSFYFAYFSQIITSFLIQYITLKAYKVKEVWANNVPNMGRYFSSIFVSIMAYSPAVMRPFVSMDLAIVIVVQYSFSALNISSLMTLTSKAICDVAGMRAIFSVGITVGCECFTAMRTLVVIDGLFVYHLRVSIPPDLPAFAITKQ